MSRPRPGNRLRRVRPQVQTQKPTARATPRRARTGRGRLLLACALALLGLIAWLVWRGDDRPKELGNAMRQDLVPNALAAMDTSFAGQVLASNGLPIPREFDARVCLVDAAGRITSANTDSDGCYAKAALPFGHYWLTASADGHRPVERQFELGPKQPKLRADFVLQEAVRLPIVVLTEDGHGYAARMAAARAPIAARVLVPMATEREPQGSQSRLQPVAQLITVGHFEANSGTGTEELPGSIGVLTLHGDLPIHVSLLHHERILKTVRVAEAGPLTFVIDPEDVLADLAPIRVEVVDARSGIAIDSAVVRVLGGSHEGLPVVTDAAGRATLAPRESGFHVMSIEAVGHESRLLSIAAVPGTTTDVGRVALEPEVVLRGRLLDAQGSPCRAELSVGILLGGSGAIRWLPTCDVRNHEQGAFELHGLGRHTYVVATRHDLGDVQSEASSAPLVSRPHVVDTRTGTPPELAIQLAPASRLVLGGDPATASGTLFLVTDEQGLEIASGSLPYGRPCSLHLHAGRYGVIQKTVAGAITSRVSIELGREPHLLRIVH